MTRSSVRLRRSDTSAPGITRRRHGKGYAFRYPDGEKVTDAVELERLRGLAVPPAWTEVWICPYANGHIQATGVDDAGRKQYIYHERWREKQAEKKFDHVLDVGDALPTARPKITRLLQRKGTDLDTACAVAFRLFDTTGIRVGNEGYAEANDSYGLTTMLIRHVRVEGDTLILEFPAKSGQRAHLETRDADLVAAMAPMLARSRDDVALAHHRDDGWHSVSSDQVNDFLREITGVDMTAKDFRTWHATVIAARELARRFEPEATERDRKWAVKEAVEAVAAHLQNTPTIARNSYVDPRVIDLFEEGKVLETGSYRQAERGLREFLTG